MKNLVLVVLLISVSMFAVSCAQAIRAQQIDPSSTDAPPDILNGQYTYWSEGQYWGGGQDGTTALPANVPGYIPKILYDSGTFDADGHGHATQCGGGSWGTWSTNMNCVTWTWEFGVSDESGINLNNRFGIIKSNVGDIATLACTKGGKHCVMTAHKVGWAWTQILDRE